MRKHASRVSTGSKPQALHIDCRSARLQHHQMGKKGSRGVGGVGGGEGRGVTGRLKQLMRARSGGGIGEGGRELCFRDGWVAIISLNK